jgi:uncharacterized delta-60 repeat protein
MSIISKNSHYGPKLVTDGLVLALDAANSKSYPGIGTTWTDLSGSGNNGTLTNGPTYSSNNLGALNFDGIDDYSALTSNYTLSAGWTLSFWGNPIFDSTVFNNTVFYSASNPRTYSLLMSTSIFIVGIDFDASNNLYVSSAYTDGNGNLSTLKFNSSYQLDTNFNCGDIGFYSPRPWQTKLSTYYPGKLYVAYHEYILGKFNQKGLRRLNSNGSLDTSFNSGGVGFNLNVHDFEEDSNGKLYVAGQFTSYNGTEINRIVRLNTDGSIDTSFNVGTGFNGFVVYNLEWDSTNNKLYVFGDFTTYNGTSINRIVRLNTDGSIDNTFSIGTGFNSACYIGKLDSNGKLYVGGFFTSYNGTGANRIIRLNSDGSIDTNFVYGTGINSGFVSHIEIDSSGKIFVCGSNFTLYNGTTANDIVKLNSDGSIDTSFSTGTGFNGPVRVLKQDSTGKLVIGGGFTSYNGTTVSSLILLNSDGTLNTDIMSGFSAAGRLENYYTDSNTYSILDLYEAGVTPQKIITSTQLYSIFNGNTSINVVESMSTTGAYRYYMNGVLLVQAENVPTTGVNIQGLMRGVFGGYWYKGKMSNISIYNRALTAAEIQQNYLATKSRYF